jgi:SpoVK/Ycf46/Vps4 family AAA+-type ATPase
MDIQFAKAKYSNNLKFIPQKESEMTQSVISYAVENADDLIYLNKGMMYKFPEFLFKYRDTVERFLAEIAKEHSFEKYDLSNSSGLIIRVISDDFTLLIIYDDEMIRGYGKAKSLELINKFNIIYNSIIKNELSELTITMFSYFLNNIGGCDYVRSFFKNDFKPKKNYIPYIDTDEMFKQFFGGDENILLLVGKSGTGKSKLTSLAIEYLASNKVNSSNRTVATISDANILLNDCFWYQIRDNNIDLVILDDFDFMLGSRDSEDTKHNKFLSKFLTFTDGVRKNKIKFIVTTNQEYRDMDKAILRKGRLFDVLEMRELSLEEGLEIWKSEGITEPYPFDNSVTIADLVYCINNLKVTTPRKEYLKDLSVRKTNIGKRIGF